jgi:lysophosphatidate acyltransferase
MVPSLLSDAIWLILSTSAYIVGAVAGLPVLLYMLSPISTTAGTFARLLVSYLALLVCSTYGVLISIVFRALGCHGLSQWAAGRSFKWAMKYAAGVTFTIEDPHDRLRTNRPAVFIGNHQTELDVLMLGCIFPPYCSVTAKRSLKSTPFLGWFMALSGSVFIDRANSDSARESMAGAVAQMKAMRQSVYMFPEGTRSYYEQPGLLPFKKGAFHLAVQAGVPLVPIVVENYSHVLSVSPLRFRGGDIRVRGERSRRAPANADSPVLAPIQTAALSAADVDELARSTRELMLREITALTERRTLAPVAASAGTATGAQADVPAPRARGAGR